MTSFAEELKSHTASAHEHAEQAGFVTELLAGRMETSQVAALLLQNYVIYQALESALDINPDPRLAPFADPALLRVPALKKDLAVHYGEHWEQSLAAGQLYVTPGARAYADELAALGPGSATYLMAHHYVRYLGDLSGGQIISALSSATTASAPMDLTFTPLKVSGRSSRTRTHTGVTWTRPISRTVRSRKSFTMPKQLSKPTGRSSWTSWRTTWS